MSDLEHIGDDTLHTSLMEMSIRGILNEEDIDELIGGEKFGFFGEDAFDQEEITTALLDQMQDLVAPLEAVDAGSWPQFAMQVNDIQKKIESIANRGAIAKFFSKGGKRAQTLVTGLARLKVYANELGKRIKSDSNTTISRDIHGLSPEDKAAPLGSVLSKEQLSSLTAYINTLHNDHNADGDLDALGFKRKTAVDAFLELKANDIDSLADVLAGIPIPSPAEFESMDDDSDDDGIPDVLEIPETAGDGEAEAVDTETEDTETGDTETEEIVSTSTALKSDTFSKWLRRTGLPGPENKSNRIKIVKYLKDKEILNEVKQLTNDTMHIILAEALNANAELLTEQVDDYRRWRLLAGM